MPFQTQMPRLQRLLAIDALTCTSMGLILIVLPGTVAAITQLPEALLFWVGLSLLPIAAFIAVTARQTPPPAWAVSMIVIGNAGWVLASIVLLMTPLIAPNFLGWLFVLSQAGVVAVLAWLEIGSSGMKRTPAHS